MRFGEGILKFIDRNRVLVTADGTGVVDHQGVISSNYKITIGSSTEFRKKKTRPDRLSGGSPGRFHRGHHLLDPKDKTRIKKIYQMITILWLIVILASGGRSTVQLKYPKFHGMNDNPGLLPLKLGNAQN
ncbi:unnamed protein product, partial [Callosobruchus maculatus]